MDKNKMEHIFGWANKFLILVIFISLALIIKDCSNNITVYDTRELNSLCEEAGGELYNNRCFNPQDEIELEFE